MNAEYIDPFSDENPPHVKATWLVYRIWRQGWYQLYVAVEDSGHLTVENMSNYLGKQFGKMTHEERREVYEFLTEWEFAEWRNIGPEDRELFATTKLDKERGVREYY